MAAMTRSVRMAWGERTWTAVVFFLAIAVGELGCERNAAAQARADALQGDGVGAVRGDAELAAKGGRRGRPASTPARTESRFWQHNDGTITFEGLRFTSWADYLSTVEPTQWRCATPSLIDGEDVGRPEGGVASDSSDCSAGLTNPSLEYAPNAKYCIQVVVHVLRNSAGTLGDVPVSRIVEQIDILNTDYSAARIEFQLATSDPTGHPTSGFIYYNSDTWFNDGGDYWNTIAWDTNRYLNIYTNTASGNLGYVPAYPSSGTIVGTKADRVVIHWQNFGKNPSAAPHGLGRVAVHEVGHWLGLYHTFQDGCGTSDCYGSGDRICDTNKESAPHFGCAPQVSCSDGADPIDNFMDYSDEQCMTRFTCEQILRMRCTLLTWRSELPRVCVIPGDLDGDGAIGAADLALMLGSWGNCGIPCLADLDGDGVVGAEDFAILLGEWGGGPVNVPSWATLLEAAPDPAVVTDASLREAIVATGLAWRVRDNVSQVEMVLVPPGSFDMGCSPSNQFACDADENPVHEVTLTCPFYLGRYEVTQAQWTAALGSNPSFFSGPNYPDAANRPVETVSWNSLQLYLAATGVRLPTEAEWEYAYRAGTASAFHSMPGFPTGTNEDAQVGAIAWYSTNSGAQTHVVGGRAANALGLHDMSGNVWEWVGDWHSLLYYSAGPTFNPPGPSLGTAHVLRGGSFLNNANSSRASYRYEIALPNLLNNINGCRVARTP